MSIGSTAAWNHSILFPTEDCSEDDENYSKSDTREDIIDQSIETWKKAPICFSVASIHASYPRKEETDDDVSLSSDSYFYIENEDMQRIVEHRCSHEHFALMKRMYLRKFVLVDVVRVEVATVSDDVVKDTLESPIQWACRNTE